MQKFMKKGSSFVKQQVKEIQTKIYTVRQLNMKMKSINDFHSLQAEIQQLLKQIPSIVDDTDTFVIFSRRLLQAVNFQLQNLPYDFSLIINSMKSLICIRKNWQAALLNYSLKISNGKCLQKELFFLNVYKEDYFFYLLKGYNTLAQKQIQRKIKGNLLNDELIGCLKQNKIKNYWTKIHQKMIQVMKDTQNQTYVKIQLLIQFIKNTLIQVNFCNTFGDFDQLFSRIKQLALHGFRLIKKFYSQQIFKLIKQFKLILAKFMSIYRVVCLKRPEKLIQINNYLAMLNNIKGKRRKSSLNDLRKRSNEKSKEKNTTINLPLNPNAFAIKLALRILQSWENIQSQKLNLLEQNQKNQKNIQNQQFLFRKKRIQNQKKKRQELLENLDHQKIILKRKIKRTISLGHLKQSQMEVFNKVKIRKQIQFSLNTQFMKQKHSRPSLRQNKPFYCENGSFMKQRGNGLIISESRKRSYSFRKTLGMSLGHKNIELSNKNEIQLSIEDCRKKLIQSSKTSSKQKNQQKITQFQTNRRKSLSNRKITSGNNKYSVKNTNKKAQINFNQPHVKLKL